MEKDVFEKQRIVAIGGGEIGRPRPGNGYYPVETVAIDKEIIKLSGKRHPRLLFLPTASGDSGGYVSVVEKHFGESLGCKVSSLLLKKEEYSRNELEKKILGADIIYVGGGNTMRMIRLWKTLGVDVLLQKARKKGIVLSGLSAGAICWCCSGNSDSRKINNPKADYIKVSGLCFFKLLLCPHYDVENARQSSLKRMMKKVSGVSLALDNCAALEVVGEKARIISSKPKAQGYKIFWSKGKFVKQKIKKNTWFELRFLTKKEKLTKFD